MEDALISVIVPVYNVEATLPRCLDSIENQTYRNLEIILVDDGSTDGSGRLCDEYATKDPRASVIHQPNKGLWAARNAGVDAAHGAFLFMPDADDYFHYDTIRLLAESMTFDGNEYSVAICLYKRTSRTDEDVLYDCHPSRSIVPQEELIQQLLSPEIELYSVNWNKLYRKKSLPEPFQRPYLRMQDYDSMLRFFLSIESAVLVESVLYYYYQHKNQVTKAPSAWTKGARYEVEILHSNYLELCGSHKKYSHLFLDRLYRKMAQLKALNLRTEEKAAIFKRCRELYKSTLSDYLHEKSIPFRIKAIFLAAFHLPFLTSLVFNFFDKHPTYYKYLS